MSEHANGNVVVDEASKERSTTAEQLMQQHALADDAAAPAPEAEKRKGGKPKARGLDVSSDEAFPSLGGGLGKAASAPAMSGWGAGMASPAASNGNRVNGGASAGAFTPAVLGSGGQSTVYLLPTQKRPVAELRKHPVELVKDIMRSTGTKIEMQQTSTQTTVFIISGAEANRQRAHREIHSEMSAKKTVTIKIPVIVRPHIIGKAGSKVQELENTTATRIKVPHTQASDGPAAKYDDEETIDITIEGDEYGVPIAVQKINSIVAEKTITVTTRILDVPGEFYPFIQGPHRKFVEEYETKVQKVQIPDYFHSARSQPFSPASGPIVITGEKRAIQEVRAEIERKVDEFKAAGFHHVLVPVSKAKHRFFTSNRGHLIHDVLTATGCTVILPEGAKVDSVIVYGPGDKIPQGYQEVFKAADAYQLASLDVSKAYSGAPGGSKLQARDITRYLNYKGEFRSMQSEFDVEITVPSGDELYDLQGPCVVYIIGKSLEGVDGAKAKIRELYTKLTPARVLRFEVEPLHHRLIVGKDGWGVKRITDRFPGLGLLLPEDTEEAEIVLVYDGSSENSDDISKSLEEAKEHILQLIEGQKFDVAENVIIVSSELHAKVQGEGGTTLNALNPSSVHVHFGAPKARPGKALVTSPGEEDKITLRGPKANVDNLINAIQQFLASIPEDGNIPLVNESFPYPVQLSAQLIGAKGANVNRLRADFGVEISLKEGQGEIKGIRVAVDAAKRRLNTQIKEHLDKAVEHLRIPQEFHSTIIGSGGNSVRKLETRYSVRITFPRSAREKEADGADLSAKQDANEVIIRGGKDGVSKARAEILALWEYEKDKSFTATIPVTARALEFMFMNASREIKQLRDESSIRLDFPQRDAIGNDEKAVIKIRGTQDEVKNAKNILTKIAEEAEQTTQQSIIVEKKYHRSLIGQGGQTLKEIVAGAGGSDDRQAHARMVRFPGQGIESDEIVIQGNAAIVRKIIAAIEKIVEQKKNEITETIMVAPEKHRQLIGREGSIRKELEARFKVTIDIPRWGPDQTNTSSDIKITGIAGDIQKAKEHILEMVKEAEGETIQIPTRLYHAVADGGQFVRRLQRDFRVTIDYNGRQRPMKPEERKPDLNGSLPLITDDEDDTTQHFTWEIVERDTPVDEAGDFPWIIRGKPEHVANARTEIEKAVALAEQQSCVGYLVLPDPSKFGLIIGPSGTQVDKIRRDTGCRVAVPRAQDVGEPIVIHGSKEGVGRARDIILGLVRGDANVNGRGVGRRRGNGSGSA